MLESIRVGHAGNQEGLSGCTVFLLPPGCSASCEVRGGAPGTRETDLLGPTFTVEAPDAILLTGGSAFGLAAAQGVMKYLEEQGIGYPTPGGPVPIVSSANIFDIDVGGGSQRPGPEMGYQACLDATVDECREGSIGVGLGAMVGSASGRTMMTRGGFGLYRFQAGEFRLEVAAVVNAFGDVVDESGRIIAGTRDPGGGFVNSEKMVCQLSGLEGACTRTNTTLVVIATNAVLTKAQAARVSLQGHNGLARAIRPSHTRYDGDTVFSLSTNRVEVSQDAVEVLAASGTARAIRSGVMRASAAAGIPSACDILSASELPEG